MAFYPLSRQARRTFLVSLAGAAALAVAGCQGGSRVGPGPVDPGPVQPVEARRHLVAVIVPLSGGDAGIGQSIANAADLALSDSGNASIRLTRYDSAAPGGAAGATAQAIRDGAGLIVGPLLADDVRAAALVARKANVPLISFSNDERVAGGGVYLMGFTPTQSIDRVVGHARAKGMARFAALIPSGLYGQRASQAMLDAVNRSGGRMTAIETFARNPAGLRAAISRLKARGAYDAVLVADAGRIAAIAAPLLPRAAKILGTELWASDRTLGKTAALRGAWYAAAPDARFNQLVTRYRARYAKSPYRLASLGYDAVLLATRAAKGWRFGRPFPAGTLTDRDGFTGVDGNFRFGRDGIAERLLEVRQVGATGTSVASPASNVF